MNIQNLFKLKKAKNTFIANHPKLPGFAGKVKKKGFCEDQEIAIAVRYPDGTEYKTGIRVKPTDLELLNAIKDL